MLDNENHDPHGYFQDNAGRFYRTPDNKPPTRGTPVSISEKGQTYDGIWSGGYAEKKLRREEQELIQREAMTRAGGTPVAGPDVGEATVSSVVQARTLVILATAPSRLERGTTR